MARRLLAASMHSKANRLVVFSATALGLVMMPGTFAACANGRVTTITITAGRLSLYAGRDDAFYFSDQSG